MARTTGGKDTDRVALAQVEELMRGSVDRADALRGDGLGTLAAAKRAKLVQTRRERARLALRFGEDSPQVARVDRRMASEHAFLVEVRAESDRASLPVLERDDKLWKLHGFVRNQDGVGRRDVAVSLTTDKAGKSTVAETTTDERGYFAMTLGGGKDDTGASSNNLRARAFEAESDDEVKTSERYVRRLVASLSTNVYLVTRAAGSSRPQVEAAPLNPMPGFVAYRIVVLSADEDDGQVCQLRTRYLGNSSTREIHDLENEKPACNIAKIRPDHRFYFGSPEEAAKLRYDYCAKCFGKDMSQR